MKIGELSKRTACPIETIRYYEKEGLLPIPERSEGNYRLYRTKDMERLQFIRHCRQHNMSLEEIRGLLAYRDSSGMDCIWVSELLDAHISKVDSQLRSLAKVKNYLQGLRNRCSGGSSAQSCPIMQGLEDLDLCGCGSAIPLGQGVGASADGDLRKKQQQGCPQDGAPLRKKKIKNSGN